MKIIKLSIALLSASFFLISCNQDQQQTAATDPYQDDQVLATVDQEDYWAKDNLDLQRVNYLLERSSSPQEFEQYLNSDEGFNNLDLNGDGYVDYISVDEFDDRGPSERGLSLYTRFGPDLVQEIASVIFYRDQPDARGARVLLRGNEQIYGDNYQYETNWLDRSVALVSALFTDRSQPYRSPYYYDNYPANYQAYEVVETPVYRTRIQQAYPEPVFVTVAAPAIVERINIRSPHQGKWMNNVRARLAQPTREQVEFITNNPRPRRGDRRDRDDRGDRREDRPNLNNPSTGGPPPGLATRPGQSWKRDEKGSQRQDRDDRDNKGKGREDKPKKPDNEGKRSGRGDDRGKGKGRP